VTARKLRLLSCPPVSYFSDKKPRPARPVSFAARSGRSNPRHAQQKREDDARCPRKLPRRETKYHKCGLYCENQGTQNDAPRKKPKRNEPSGALRAHPKDRQIAGEGRNRSAMNSQRRRNQAQIHSNVQNGSGHRRPERQRTGSSAPSEFCRPRNKFRWSRCRETR